MGRMVSATEFKAKCLQLIAQMEKDGESLTITRRGKPVAELQPSKPAVREKRPLFGSMKGTLTWAPGVDPTAPVVDDNWETQWEAKWDRLLDEGTGSRAK